MPKAGAGDVVHACRRRSGVVPPFGLGEATTRRLRPTPRRPGPALGGRPRLPGPPDGSRLPGELRRLPSIPRQKAPTDAMAGPARIRIGPGNGPDPGAAAVRLIGVGSGQAGA